MATLYLNISLAVLNGLIFIVTIALNLLAIIYILTQRDRTSIAMLVVNLAIADIIHATGIVFFNTNLFTPNWVFGEFGCKFSITVDVLCTIVIAYTVAGLSIERYLDARSFLTAKLRLYTTMGTLAFIWSLGLLLPFPFIIFTYLNSKDMNSTGNSNATETVFSCESHLSEKQLFIHEIILYIIAFIIPYSIIVIFSLKLLRFLRDWLKRKEKLTRTSVSKRRTRGVKLVLCIVLSFLICNTPFWAFKFYMRHLASENLAGRTFLRRFLYYAHYCVVVLNNSEGVLNPLFFIVLTDRFRLTFSRRQRRKSNFFLIPSNKPTIAQKKKTSKMASSTNLIGVKISDGNDLLLPMNEQIEKDKSSSIIS